VLVIGPETLKLEVSDADISQALDLARAEGLSPSALAKSIARQLDVPRSRVYDLLLEANRQQE